MLIRKRVFTLIELVTVVIIIGILSGLGVVGYNQVLENAKAKVCATNQKALEKAVEIYSLEHDTLPSSLGQLKLEDLQKGYAQALKGRRLRMSFYYWFIKVNTPKQAYATFLTPENLKKYGASEKIFHCPSDLNGGVSYGINADLKGLKWRDIPKGTPIIADCDSPTFNSTTVFPERHKRKFLTESFAQVELKNRGVFKGNSADCQAEVDAVHDDIVTFKDCKDKCDKGPNGRDCLNDCGDQLKSDIESDIGDIISSIPLP